MKSIYNTGSNTTRRMLRPSSKSGAESSSSSGTASGTASGNMKRLPQRRLLLKTKKSQAILLCSSIIALLLAYSTITTNANAEWKARRLLLEEREEKAFRELITIDKGNGTCDIGSPVQDAPLHPVSGEIKTLLASYPGSGKRFTWTVIKALTNYEVADDWNFSGKLHQNPLAIKTSWPHGEGIWSWGTQMDQVLLLIRNPRRAIPSYHTMRWELGYATDWPSSYLHIPNTYMKRPTVEQWELWRDIHANREIDSWYNFYNFWSQAGYNEDIKSVHPRCLHSDIDCQPKDVVNFDNLYTDAPTTDFLKIGSVLDASPNVQVISQQARECVLKNVFNRTNHQDLNMHQGSRPFPELTNQYTFTVPQLERMFNRTITLRDKFIVEPLSLKPYASDFVAILDRYVSENTPEYYREVDYFLEEFVSTELGDFECGNLVGNEVHVCIFMKNKDNHGVFSNNDYPDNYPYATWLKVRR